MFEVLIALILWGSMRPALLPSRDARLLKLRSYEYGAQEERGIEIRALEASVHIVRRLTQIGCARALSGMQVRARIEPQKVEINVVMSMRSATGGCGKVAKRRQI